MPGDLNSSVGFVDVEFGALDMISDSNSFDGVSDNKFTSNSGSGMESTTPAPSSSLDLSAVSQPSALDSYTNSPPKPTQPQSSINSALSQSQMVRYYNNKSIKSVFGLKNLIPATF